MNGRTVLPVVCPHGTVTTFTKSSVKGGWIISARDAERVTDDNGVTRWHYAMWCGKCRINVPVVKPDRFGPFLDRLLEAGMEEVPLAVMARAAGASWQPPGG